MQERLSKSMDTERDSIFVFSLCDACLARRLALGIARPVEDPECYII